VTFFLNLFNLIPIPPLDGGWVVAPLFSRPTPVAAIDRWWIGAAYIGLALGLFVMWHVAGDAVRLTLAR
jgi:Zn-dependent protease